MWKFNTALLAGSAVIFAASVAAASFHYDGAPDRDADRTTTRKNGDMFIYYGGRSYYHRSMTSRRGGVGMRSYRGGGLRGGK